MWRIWLLAVFELFIFLPALVFYVLYLSSIIFNKKKPPFVPSNKRLAELIATELAIEPGMRVIELGAGDMRISLACWRQEPAAHYLGIERHPWPRFLARGNIMRAGAHSAVRVQSGDLYAADLTGVDRVYCYLFPTPMQVLLPKFERELPKGALVASLDFPINAKEPEKVIDLTPCNLKLGKELYLYRF